MGRKSAKGKKLPQVVTCPHCLLDLGRTAFNANPILKDGVDPWCRECQDEISEEGNVDRRKALRTEYEKAYQRAYHAIYAERMGEERRETKKGLDRLTREAAERILGESLTVETLRRESVQAELLRLLGRMWESPTWKEFEDRVIEEVGEDWVRILSAELYPEFIFSIGNYGANGKARFPVCQELTRESVELLGKAITEAVYEV